MSVFDRYGLANMESMAYDVIETPMVHHDGNVIVFSVPVKNGEPERLGLEISALHDRQGRERVMHVARALNAAYQNGAASKSVYADALTGIETVLKDETRTANNKVAAIEALLGSVLR